MEIIRDITVVSKEEGVELKIYQYSGWITSGSSFESKFQDGL